MDHIPSSRSFYFVKLLREDMMETHEYLGKVNSAKNDLLSAIFELERSEKKIKQLEKDSPVPFGDVRRAIETAQIFLKGIRALLQEKYTIVEESGFH